MEPFARLTVRTRDVDGPPAAGAQVTFDGKSADEHVIVRANGDGLAELMLKAGSWRVSAQQGRAESAPMSVRLAPGERRSVELLFVKEPLRLRVGGVVLDEMGRPLPLVKVELEVHRRRWSETHFCFSAGDGSFSFEASGPDAEVRVADPRFARTKRAVRAPDEGLQLRATPPLRLSIQVVDESNARVSDAHVEVSALNFDEKYLSASTIVLSQLPAGAMKTRALRVVEGRFESAEVDLYLKQDSEVTLRLLPRPALQGVVKDPGGLALAGVRVVALSTAHDLNRSVMSAPTGEDDASGFTGPDGAFILAPRRMTEIETQYRLQVLGPGLREPEHPVLSALGGPPVQIDLIRGP